MESTDTIAAIATPPGEGGIGVVRVSGPQALQCARAVFRRRSPLPEIPQSHRVYVGWVVHPETGVRLDDCVLTWFQAPTSYTGENTAELACHGSTLVLRRVLDGLIAAGARLAAPGEFTQRAFLNGRMDLAAAESVIDVIRARTEAALRVATSQLEGRLSREVRTLRHELITLLAEIEAAIDFPDDVEPPEDAEVSRRAEAVRTRIRELLRTADAGRLYREGAAVVLAGRPNVGKSSLLNALLGEARAIVTPIPGTTRDVIEETLNLQGIPVRALDTAGLRDTRDPVERLGVERTRAALDTADAVIWVVDASQPLEAEDLQMLEHLAGKRWVAALNKCDLGLHPTLEDSMPPGSLVPVSALSGEGLKQLRAALAEVLGRLEPESVWVSHARHEARLRAAEASLRLAVEASGEGFHQAAVALDLRQAADALGEVTGETVAEETISQIFARFCVGK